MPCTRCGAAEVTTHVRRLTHGDDGVRVEWPLELCASCASAEETRHIADAQAARDAHQHRMASEALIEAIREEIATATERSDVEALAAAARFLALMGPELIDGLPPDLEALVATYGPPRA